MFRLSLPLALLALFASSLPVCAQREKLSPEDLEIVNKRFPTATRTITGLRYVIDREGHGEPARSGDIVSVVYKGMLINGTVFNEYLDPKDPFTFRLGRGQVIDGWDQGLKYLKEGGKMTLIVPFELGYGTKGNPPAIPRQSTLIFEVELVKIERGSATPPPTQVPLKKADKKKKTAP